MMRRRLVTIALAAVLVTVGMGVSIPAVRAEVQRVLTVVTVTGSALPVSQMASPSPFAAFKSGSGTIVVGGSLGVVGPDGALPSASQDLSSEEVFQDGDRFLVVKKTAADGNTALPEGQKTTVNGKPATLRTGLAGEYRQALPTAEDAVDENGKPAVLPTPIVIVYTNANQLTWIADGVRYEIISNLPVKELLQVAFDPSAAK